MDIEQVRSGRPVAEVAAMPELPESTVFRWSDRTRSTGRTGRDIYCRVADLRAAKCRIAKLEAELATVKRGD